MKNMSFSLTTQQVRQGTKTVTRRMGWNNLKPGQRFCAVEKGMGLKKGEKVVRIAVLRCISNEPEALNLLIVSPAYGAEEAIKEGFPQKNGQEFVEFFIKSHKGCTRESHPNRIEFEYVRFLP